MKYPIAIEPGDDESSWGVVVPDLPGCFSASDDGLDDAIERCDDLVIGHPADKVASRGEALARGIESERSADRCCGCLGYDNHCRT